MAALLSRRLKSPWAVAALVLLTSLLLWHIIFRSSVPTRHRFGTSEVDSPTPFPYSAVILYLASAARLSELFQSLALVHLNLPTAKPWPIVLFHTGDFDAEAARLDFFTQLRDQVTVENGSSSLEGRIEFVKLDWQLPEGIPHDKDVLDPVWAQAWPGYQHMCAFFTSKIFDHPRLRSVTYYLRLDTDSFIEEPLCYDPIEVMHVRNRIYGYRYLGSDPPEVSRGMWALVDSYANEHPSIDERMRENGWNWPGGRVLEEMEKHHFPGFYNNFEIVRLEAFRRADVRAWLEEVASVPERAYKYRWGDSPIRYATVNMFFNMKNDTEEFCGMRYFHQFRPEKQCECVPLESS